MRFLALAVSFAATLAAALPGAPAVNREAADASAANNIGAKVGTVTTDTDGFYTLTLNSDCTEIPSPAYYHNIDEGYQCKFFTDSCNPSSGIETVGGLGYILPHASWYFCFKIE